MIKIKPEEGVYIIGKEAFLIYKNPEGEYLVENSTGIIGLNSSFFVGEEPLLRHSIRNLCDWNSNNSSLNIINTLGNWLNQSRECNKLDCPEHYTPQQLVKKEVEVLGYCGFQKSQQIVVHKGDLCMRVLPRKEVFSQSLPKCTDELINLNKQQFFDSHDPIMEKEINSSSFYSNSLKKR